MRKGTGKKEKGDRKGKDGQGVGTYTKECEESAFFFLFMISSGLRFVYSFVVSSKVTKNRPRSPGYRL